MALDKYLMKQDNPLEKYKPKITQLSTDNIYDKQLKSLEEMYGQSKTNLATQNQNQLQQAAVSQQLLQKYLPNQLNALGIQNTGMAQSSLVNLLNAYGLQRGNIQQAHQAGLSDLESNYLTNRANIEQNQYQQQQADQQNIYNDLASYISVAETKEQADSLLERYKDNISDVQYKFLQDQIGLQNYGQITPEQSISITNPKTTEQTNVSNLNEVLSSIQNSNWGKSGWDRFWADNPEFTYNGIKYRVDTTTNYAGNNKEAQKAIKAMTPKGVAAIVTYKGKDYLTDGNVIYQVKIK